MYAVRAYFDTVFQAIDKLLVEDNNSQTKLRIVEKIVECWE